MADSGNKELWDVALGFVVCERVAVSFLLVFYVTQVMYDSPM